MTNNFTPLKNKNLLPSSRGKIFFILEKFSYVFFIFSLAIFSANVLIPSLINYSSQKTKASSSYDDPKIYQPRFKNIDQLYTVPRKINNITIDNEKIYSYFKNKYSSLSKNELIKTINMKIFSFLISTSSSQWDLLTNFDGDLFEKELEKNLTKYQNKVKKLTFYYFKTRFRGTTEENLKALNLDPEKAREYAQNKINYYYNLRLPPDDLMKKINNDQEIILLNNNEISAERIEDYDHETPIFDDPDFYNLLINSSVNNYSRIYTFKTVNPHSPEFEDYAFVFLYVVKVEGENMPLNININNFISKSLIL